MKLAFITKTICIWVLLCTLLEDIMCEEEAVEEEDTAKLSRRRQRRRQRIRQLMQSDQPPPGFALYNTFRVSGGGDSSTSTPATSLPSQHIDSRQRSDHTNDHHPVVLEDPEVIEGGNVVELSVYDTADSGVAVVAPYDPKDGDLRLVGGRTDNEGNIQVFHAGEWGSICDDEWDSSEARIACKQLGFPGTTGPTHSSQFGYTLSKVWMDNMFCYGTESKITDCRFDGWGIHDCERTEAAGVRCHERLPPTTPAPLTTTPKPKTPIRHKFDRKFRVRLTGGRVKEEGRVEVSLTGSSSWSTVCGDGWGIPEAMVVCREVGLRYAQSAIQTHLFTPVMTAGNGTLANSLQQDVMEETIDFRTRPLLTGVSCRGNELSLYHCHHDADTFCPGDGGRDVAAVVCVEEQADLEPDIYELMTSAHLEDKQLFFLSCAMEENCLASEAYRLRRDRYDYATETRRLLRFTTSIVNIGNADFRPLIPKENWVWHGCHQHYHSMEVFAHFDILDAAGHRVAEGHKASFCLEDNHCSGVDPKYNCENYGDQGITPGCKDIYYYNIDCQWLDVTEVPLGTYTFRMAINPEFKVAEQTFENNAAVCTLFYTEQFASIRNCTLARP